MNIKELYSIANKELKDLTSLEQADFRLEQAEFKKDEELWEIVVSYLVENINKPISPIGALASGYKFQRIYKKLKINKNKEVLGFYIYDKQ